MELALKSEDMIFNDANAFQFIESQSDKRNCILCEYRYKCSGKQCVYEQKPLPTIYMR